MFKISQQRTTSSGNGLLMLFTKEFKNVLRTNCENVTE